MTDLDFKCIFLSSCGVDLQATYSFCYNNNYNKVIPVVQSLHKALLHHTEMECGLIANRFSQHNKICKLQLWVVTWRKKAFWRLGVNVLSRRLCSTLMRQQTFGVGWRWPAGSTDWPVHREVWNTLMNRILGDWHVAICKPLYILVKYCELFSRGIVFLSVSFCDHNLTVYLNRQIELFLIKNKKNKSIIFLLLLQNQINAQSSDKHS